MMKRKIGKAVPAVVMARLAVVVMALCLAGCGAQPAGESAAAGGGGESQAAAEKEEKPELDEAGWAPGGAVSVIVPAGAGGNTDTSARLFARYASQITGNQFVVSNVTGSGGTVAANQVLAALPDGHTVLYGHNLVNVANVAGIADYHYGAFTLGPTFVKDPAQQFYVNAGTYPDLDSFMEAAKAAPGRLRACTEVGAYTYYELKAFEHLAGIDIALVDVGSNKDKIAAMVSGQVDLMPCDYLSAKEYLDSGQFFCLGVPSQERLDTLPDIPTLKEQGIDFVYPDCDFSFYFPKGTPKEVIAYYEDLVQMILADQEALEEIDGMHMMPYYLSGEESEAHDEEIYRTIKALADGMD